MSRFKTCGAAYCDRIAKRVVKLYLEEKEEKIGGWKDTNPANPELFDCGRGFAVPKEVKFHKVRVCNKCYEEAEPGDFCYISGQDGQEKVISRVVRV